MDWRARALAAADDLARVTRERDALAAERDRLRRGCDDNIAEVRRLDNEMGIARTNYITVIIERDDAIRRAEKAEEARDAAVAREAALRAELTVYRRDHASNCAFALAAKEGDTADCDCGFDEPMVRTLRTREAALREALAELWTWQATVQELPPDDVSERVKAALAKEST